MESHEIRVKLNGKSDCFYIAGLFDIHYGVKACDEMLLERDIERIRTTPNMYCFLGGDLCDYVNASDKRFDPKTLADKSIRGLDDLAKVQADRIISLLTPIKHKIWFTLTGNHEEKIRLKYHQDIINYIAMGLGIPNLGYTALIRVVAQCGLRNDISFRMYTSHGTGGSSSLTGKIKKTLDLMFWIEADIYWTGHLHAKASVMQPRLYMSHKGNPVVKALNRLFVLGGTYLKTYMKNEISYGEKAGYCPTPLGCEVIKVVPFPGTYRENGNRIDKPMEFIAQTTGSGSLDMFTKDIKE